MNKADTFAAVAGLNAALAANSTAKADPAKAPKPNAAKAARKPKTDADPEAAAAVSPVQTQTARAIRAAATGLKEGDEVILDFLAPGLSKAAVAKQLGEKAYAVNAA